MKIRCTWLLLLSTVSMLTGTLNKCSVKLLRATLSNLWPIKRQNVRGLSPKLLDLHLKWWLPWLWRMLFPKFVGILKETTSAQWLQVSNPLAKCLSTVSLKLLHKNLSLQRKVSSNALPSTLWSPISSLPLTPLYSSTICRSNPLFRNTNLEPSGSVLSRCIRAVTTLCWALTIRKCYGSTWICPVRSLTSNLSTRPRPLEMWLLVTLIKFPFSRLLVMMVLLTFSMDKYITIWWLTLWLYRLRYLKLMPLIRRLAWEQCSVCGILSSHGFTRQVVIAKSECGLEYYFLISLIW